MLTPISQDRWTRRTADHLFHRAGFGGTPEERSQFYELGRQQGIAAAVDSLVNPTETWESCPFPSWSTDVDPNGDLFDGGSSEKRYAFVDWYIGMLRKGQPLAAKLLKFLIDHLPVDHNNCSNDTRFMYFFRYFDMLRKHAAGDVDGSGSYGYLNNLVKEVSWSEAMIRMLDLEQSSANEINENFGRELLELFTLGVNGGYTEDDVGAAAEAFTGRRLYRMQSPHPEAYQQKEKYLAPEGEPPASSYQDSSDQDLLPKSFLGFDRMPNGRTITTGDDIMELIFESIQTSKHVCWKLWRYFVSANPEESMLQTLALRLKNDYSYELRPLMRDIFLSEEFYEESVITGQIKDAGDYIIGIQKQLEVEPLPNRAIYNICEQLGYNPLFPPNIAGWPEPDTNGNEWMSAGAILLRINLPGIWTEENYDVFNDWGSKVSMEDYPDAAWSDVIPADLRDIDNFPLLIQSLSDRFLPLSPLRKSQIRLLYDRYRKTSQMKNSEYASKELIRLLIALPEYQMQ